MVDTTARFRLTARDETAGAFASASRGLDRLTRSFDSSTKRMATAGRGAGSSTLIAGLGGIAAAAVSAQQAIRGFTNTASFERRLSRVANNTNATAEQMSRFRDVLHSTADSLGMYRDSVLEGGEVLAAQLPDIERTIQMMPQVAKAAQASGASVEDLANAVNAVMTNLKIPMEEMPKVLDLLVAGGKQGQIELKQMAQYLPSLTADFARIGYSQEEGLRRIIALFQVVRTGTGEASTAFSNLTDIVNKMMTDETVNKMRELGVPNLREDLLAAKANGDDVLAVFVNIAREAAKRDPAKFIEIFADRQALSALTTIEQKTAKIDEILSNLAGKNVIGTLDSDLKNITQDSQAHIERLSNAWNSFTEKLSKTAVDAGVIEGFKSIETALDTAAAAARVIGEVIDKMKSIDRAIDEVHPFRVPTPEELEQYNKSLKPREPEQQRQREEWKNQMQLPKGGLFPGKQSSLSGSDAADQLAGGSGFDDLTDEIRRAATNGAADAREVRRLNTNLEELNAILRGNSGEDTMAGGSGGDVGTGFGLPRLAGGGGSGSAYSGGRGGGGGGGAAADGGGVAAPVTGSKAERAARAYRAARSAGFNHAQAAALTGTWEQESSFNPNAWNAREGAGGIGQWRFDRLANLRKFVAQRGGTGLGTIEDQAAFTKWEMENTERRGGRAFLEATDTTTASHALRPYVRWGHTGGRHAMARRYGEQFGDHTLAAPQGAPGPDGGAAAANGGAHPLPGMTRYSSPFGMRRHPLLGTMKMHSGTDMAGPAGSGVRATQGGEIVAINRHGDVTVRYADGSMGTYRHVSPEKGMEIGRAVEAGEQIARLRAKDPRSTGPHLHYERSVNGRKVDPRAYLDGLEARGGISAAADADEQRRRPQPTIDAEQLRSDLQRPIRMNVDMPRVAVASNIQRRSQRAQLEREMAESRFNALSDVGVA